MTTSFETAPYLAARRSRPFVRFVWVLAMLAGIGGGLLGLGGFMFANGAPQEAAAAAFGCLVAIAPYVVARSIDEMSR